MAEGECVEFEAYSFTVSCNLTILETAKKVAEIEASIAEMKAMLGQCKI